MSKTKTKRGLSAMSEIEHQCAVTRYFLKKQTSIGCYDGEFSLEDVISALRFFASGVIGERFLSEQRTADKAVGRLAYADKSITAADELVRVIGEVESESEMTPGGVQRIFDATAAYEKTRRYHADDGERT